MGKHFAEKVKNTNKNIKTFMLFICVIALTIFALVQTTMAKYVVKKELVIAVKTADYYFVAEAEKTEYNRAEYNDKGRNRCTNKLSKL